MAGTVVTGIIQASTVSDGTNSTSATNCIRGSAKAWANLNGTAATVRASYNVSSITRNSTGDYNINFTNALADTNYAVVTTISNPTLNGGVTGANYNSGFTTTTTTKQLVTYSYNVQQDFDTIYVAVFR